MSAAVVAVRKVGIDELVADKRCQARAEVSPAAVAEYAETYETAPGEMPPLDVFDVGGRYYVTDGLHRYAAAQIARVQFVRVRVVGAGDVDDAIYHAQAANKDPRGLRRTNADKNQAASQAVACAVGQDLSNRAIADHIGVSDVLVAKARAEWEASQVQTDCTSVVEAEPVRRKGKDGKSYPAKRPAPAAQVQTDCTSPDPLPFETLPETAIPMPVYGRVLLRVAADLRSARLAALSALPDDDELRSVRQSIERSIKDAEGALKNAEPVTCPKCSGAGCKPCGERGWLSRMAAAR